MARICFLFNHDQLHQVAHSLPIAVELARRGTDEVTLAVASERLAAHLRKVGGAGLERCRIVRLDLASTLSRALAAGMNGLIPARKILLYRDNVDFFRGFDALVVAEKTSLLLKSHYGLGDLSIIHTRHGAGDRAIGFSRKSAGFDLVLVAGPKIARRLEAQSGVDPARIAVTGYVKFDLYADRPKVALPFADPSLPVLLYAPHPSPRLSSWYRMGPALLDAVARSGRYNLIFAPHVMMFRRGWTVTIAPPAVRRMRRPPPRIVQAPNIHVDLGSPASSDMSYTNAADLYIGDVSSQIYEFLIRPRPCLALDAHRTRWQGNPDYTHWGAGPFVRAGEDMLAAVDTALATHADYLPHQRALLADTFCVTAQPAMLRAVDAITRFLHEV